MHQRVQQPANGRNWEALFVLFGLVCSFVAMFVLVATNLPLSPAEPTNSPLEDSLRFNTDPDSQPTSLDPSLILPSVIGLLSSPEQQTPTDPSNNSNNPPDPFPPGVVVWFYDAQLNLLRPAAIGVGDPRGSRNRTLAFLDYRSPPSMTVEENQLIPLAAVEALFAACHLRGIRD